MKGTDPRSFHGTFGDPLTPPLICKNNYINRQHNKREGL